MRIRREPQLVELAIERVPRDAEELGRSALVAVGPLERFGDRPDLELGEPQRKASRGGRRNPPTALTQPAPHVFGSDRAPTGGEAQADSLEHVLELADVPGEGI